MMKTKLFFSSEIKRNSPLQNYCEKESVQLTAFSLISFQKVSFVIEDPFDVVFFSSPRSVEYFFSENYENSDYKIACVGKGTARALTALNKTPDFIGEKSGSPESVAIDFISWLGDRSVLFPVSKRSNETIYKVVPENQKSKVVCYDTLLTPQRIEPQDWYVFTSPSNVESFLQMNTIPETAKVVAWGNTTANYLVGKGIDPQFILQESSEEALVELLSRKM